MPKPCHRRTPAGGFSMSRTDISGDFHRSTAVVRPNCDMRKTDGQSTRRKWPDRHSPADFIASPASGSHDGSANSPLPTVPDRTENRFMPVPSDSGRRHPSFRRFHRAAPQATGSSRSFLVHLDPRLRSTAGRSESPDRNQGSAIMIVGSTRASLNQF